MMFHIDLRRLNFGRLLPLIVFLAGGFFQTAVAQYNCNKYCNRDCNEYFQGDEFSSCVSAKVNCSCAKTSIRSGFGTILFALIIIGFVLCCCCACCRRRTRGFVLSTNQSVVAQPVNPAHGYPNNAYYPSATPAFTVSTAVTSPNVPNSMNPMSIPNAPTFYPPPPPYFECVKMDQSHQMQNTLNAAAKAFTAGRSFLVKSREAVVINNTNQFLGVRRRKTTALCDRKPLDSKVV